MAHANQDSTHPIAYLSYGGHSGALVMRASTLEVDKDVVHHALLQRLHVAVHILWLAPHHPVRVLRNQLIHHRVRQWTHNQHWPGHHEVPFLNPYIGVDGRLLVEGARVRVGEQAVHIGVRGKLL